MKKKERFNQVRYFFIVLLATCYTSLYSQDGVKGSGFSELKVDWNSLSHKTYKFKAEKPFVIKFKAQPNLQIQLFSRLEEEGKKPYHFAREIAKGEYEAHIVPQSVGEHRLMIVGTPMEDLYADEIDLVNYKFTSTKGHSFKDYILTVPLKPSPYFQELGYTQADIPFKRYAIKAKGATFNFKMKSPDKETMVVLVEDGDDEKIVCTDYLYGINQTTFCTAVSTVKGWSHISIYSEPLSADREDSHLLLDYWVYFPESKSLSSWEKRKKKPNVTRDEYLQDMKYDYSLIDQKVKNIPQSQNTTLKSISAYISTHAVNKREKIRGAYTWIRENIKYARDENGEPDHSEPTLADLVVEGSRKTVCAGYSKTFQGFMKLMNIDCHYISGTVSNSISKHAWNAVELNGKWRLVDATWETFFDDPSSFIFTHFPERVNDDKQPKVAEYFQCLANPISLEDFENEDFSSILSSEEVLLHKGLVAYYKFDGDIHNAEGSNYTHQSISSNYATDRFGNTQKAINLLETPRFSIDGQDLNDFSISLWLHRSKNTTVDKTLFEHKDDKGNTVFKIRVTSYGGLYFEHKNTGAKAKVEVYGGDLDDGKWTYFTIVKKGKDLLFYKNYELYNHGHLSTLPTYTKSDYKIGKEGSATFNIKVDDLRIYNRALSQNEIGKLFYERGYSKKPDR